jgi:hypothetical protein
MSRKVLTCLPKEPVPVLGVIGGKGKERNTGPGSLLLAVRDLPVNPDRRHMDENVSKCVAAMYPLAHDGGVAAWLAVEMVVSCPECGHSLWAEACGVGQFNYVVYFDDDDRSETYAEPVTSCPSCHTWCGPLVGANPARKRHHAAERG